MLKNVKAYFFDLDNTLIHYGGQLTKQAWETTCKQLTTQYSELSSLTDSIANRLYNAMMIIGLIMQLSKKLPKVLIIFALKL